MYPVALVLHRASGESLADALDGLGLSTGVDVAALWRASDLVDEHISDQPVTPLAPRIATRAAEHSLPAGLVAALDVHLRAQSAGDRLDEVIEELARIREEAGWPPLAAPIGQVLASQALLHVLSAERYQTVVDELRDLLAGRYGEPPGEISAQVRRAVELTSDGQPPTPETPDLDELREQYAGIAASEEELLLLALFGEEAQLLLETIRGRGRERLARGRRRGRVARRADPRDRPDRPGVRRRRGDDRGRRPARDRAPDARHRSGAGRGGACAGGRGGADLRGRDRQRRRSTPA